MTPQFDALLRGTKQPRTQEKGKPHFRIIEKPATAANTVFIVQLTGIERDCYEEYLTIARRMDTSTIERHLAEGTMYSWVIKAYTTVLAEREGI